MGANSSRLGAPLAEQPPSSNHTAIRLRDTERQSIPQLRARRTPIRWRVSQPTSQRQSPCPQRCLPFDRIASICQLSFQAAAADRPTTMDLPPNAERPLRRPSRLQCGTDRIRTISGSLAQAATVMSRHSISTKRIPDLCLTSVHRIRSDRRKAVLCIDTPDNS